MGQNIKLKIIEFGIITFIECKNTWFNVSISKFKKSFYFIKTLLLTIIPYKQSIVPNFFCSFSKKNEFNINEDELKLH